jgi:hypothetical protein
VQKAQAHTYALYRSYWAYSSYRSPVQGRTTRARGTGLQVLVVFFFSQWAKNMTEARELFNSLTEKDSRIHVELGDDAKYAVKGEGTILFQLESVVRWKPRMCYMYQD